MRNDDHRSKKIVFVSNCLLNTNNKVWGLARYGGFCREVLKFLQITVSAFSRLTVRKRYISAFSAGITQRIFMTTSVSPYLPRSFRRTVDYMESYKLVGYETVAFLVCNGSPTCGYDLTSYDENWGGNTTKHSVQRCHSSGNGRAH